MKITIFILTFTLSLASIANSIPAIPDFNKTLKKAEQGIASSQYNLGVIYNYGLGVTKDYKEAIKWYLKAAEQGNSFAQYNLALMYQNGQGVTLDDKEAFKWYLQAAEQGHTDAQLDLGILYANGKGVIQSNKNSYIWSSIAAANGSESASKNRDMTARKLSASTLDEAQREAAELYNKISNRIK